MNRAEIEKQVHEIVMKQFSVGPDQVTSDTLLEEGLGADSMALVELMVNLEGTFDMEMPALTGTEIERVRTVGDVVDFIETKFSTV